jgi:hypothetical protein
MKENNQLGVFQARDGNHDEKSKDRLLEQYKLYVEMADRVSSRRGLANTFFLAANTFLISFGALISCFQATGIVHNIWLIVYGISGLAFSLSWMYIVKSYRQLNFGKFKVIHEIEKGLPLAPYKAEWKALGEGRDTTLYLPLTQIERIIPLVFAVLYVILLMNGVYYLYISINYH